MASRRMRIIVCGAGIAGLCTAIGLARDGHEVTVLESAQKLSPVGGGLHVPPNATLVLQRWNILHHLESIAIIPAGFSFRRYANSKILGNTTASSPVVALSTPYWSLKRSDYQQCLYSIAITLGVTVKLGHRVTHIDHSIPAAHLAHEPSPLHADLIVIADGMRSSLRQALHASSEIKIPLETYRAWTPAAVFDSDPATAALFSAPHTNVWIGPDRHIIIYPASGGSILAINGTHPAPSTPAEDKDHKTEWNRPASVEQIQASFASFDPLVSKILSEARDCRGYTLAEVPPLPTWLSPGAKVVMIGDAAHGMLQFLAQGAAMAVEDAAALTECVRRVASSTDDDSVNANRLKRAMEVFERSRKARCEKVQAQAQRNGHFVHLPDGTEQELRDRKLKGEQDLPEEVDTGPFFDEELKAWLYGFDVFAHTNQLLDDAGL